MARERTNERDVTRIEVNCTNCGTRGLAVPRGGQTACPGCGESFSAHVTDRFTLVENDGWAVTVSLDAAGPPADRPAAGERT